MKGSEKTQISKCQKIRIDFPSYNLHNLDLLKFWRKFSDNLLRKQMQHLKNHFEF